MKQKPKSIISARQDSYNISKNDYNFIEYVWFVQKGCSPDHGYMLSQQKNLHSVNDEYNYFERGEPYITLTVQTVLLSVFGSRIDYPTG